ncbi:MAG: ribosome silencing factor [Oscillospiraceae bacterium]|nr:ribosome silencing factor [Oscillospiraceae bacterium]
MTPRQMAEKIVEVLAGKMGRDIKMIKIDAISVLADYFVICTAGSTTQIKTLCDEVEKVMEENGEVKLHREGYRSGGWVLIDYGCVVVHVFMEEARQFYGLERLWADAVDVDISDLIGKR